MISAASHFIFCLSSLLLLLTYHHVDTRPLPFRSSRTKNATTFHVAQRRSSYGYGANSRPTYYRPVYGNSYGNSMRRVSSLTRAYNTPPARFAYASPTRVVTAPSMSITYGAVYGAEPWDLLSRMGEDEYQIRQFIQRDAREQRIHPNQFDKERFKRAIVQINNRYRWMHGTEGLVPDSYSEVGAARWADGLARSGSCLVHELRHGGENLFFFASTEPYLSSPETMAEAVMKSFYIEGRNYMRYAFPARPDPSAYHYTQMLWRGSRRIGVGLSIQALPSGTGPCVPYAYGYGYSRPQAWMFYVDIRYDPIGNQAYPGNGYTENVLPLVRRV